MSEKILNQSSVLNEAAGILKTCQPLSNRLVVQGLNIELSEEDYRLLLRFERLLEANYKDYDWQYLRGATGITGVGIAALSSRLERYQAEEEYPEDKG